jgi:hypothetical protein
MYTASIYSSILTPTQISQAYTAGKNSSISWTESNNTNLIFYPNLRITSDLSLSAFEGGALLQGFKNTVTGNGVYDLFRAHAKTGGSEVTFTTTGGTVSSSAYYPTAEGVTGLTEMTFSYFIYLYSRTWVSVVASLYPYTIPGTTENYLLELNSTAGYVGFISNWTTTAGKWRVNSDVVPLNTWTHVLITYAPSGASTKPNIYVNSVSQAVTTIDTPVGTRPTTGSTTFSLGGINGGVGSISPDGVMKELHVLNRVVTSDEILQLYGGQSVTSGAVYIMGSSHRVVDPISCAIGTAFRDGVGASP